MIEKNDTFIKKLEKILINQEKELVFLCIGTDRIIGDSFGPLVGSLLKNNNIKNVIGNLEYPLSYDKLVKLKISNDKYVIAIDSALSNVNEIGEILIKNTGTSFGKSLCKNNKRIGDASINGIVGKNNFDNKYNFMSLQNISLSKIINMANFVANGIIDIMNKKIRNGKNIYII